MTSSPTLLTRTFSFLAKLAALVLSLLLCLPVILLPLATAVPAPLWILLAVLAVALLVVQFRLKPAWKGMAASLAGLVIVAVVAVVASQAFATTPPIVDAQATELDVPVYFLLGRHDINAPTVLAEEYFQLLDAPHREIVWFEHSGHTPWVSESDRFVQAMVDTVLAQTQGRGS